MQFVKGFLGFSLVVAALSMQGGAFTQPTENAQASYVRICKDSRGVPDRRACRGKDDPHRTVLAFNSPAEFAR